MLTLTSINDVKHPTDFQADFFLAACGYEPRATAVAKKFGCRADFKLALGFTAQRELDYVSNYEWFKSQGFDVVEVDDDGFRTVIDHYFGTILGVKENVALEVDISCFNRLRLGHLIDALRSLSHKKITVLFRYSIAEYAPPAHDFVPTVTVEPVIPQFAGWTTRPDKPPAAIVGLGYEPNKAIGIIDHLEINNATWAYYPLGPIPEYYQSVLEANHSLLNIIKADGRCQPYDLNEPAQLFHEMNSLVDTLKPHFNTVLIPFGPKLFALIALLVASGHEDVGVWRVSSGAFEPPVRRTPSDHVISVFVVLENNQVIDSRIVAE